MVEISFNQDSSICTITINRPESLNALSADVLRDIKAAVDKVSANTSVRVAIIKGAGGKAFMAGADIQAMSKMDQKQIREFGELGFAVMRSIENCRVPVIAAINGFALGGGLELALACDLIAVSRKAKLGQPEVNLGLITGFGGSQRLIYRCGVGVSRRLCYSAEMIDAQAAVNIGLADYLFDDDAFDAEVEKVASLIASKAPLAVEATKKVIIECVDGELITGLKNELDKFVGVFGSEDRVEGVSAFLEKRKAQFLRK